MTQEAKKSKHRLTREANSEKVYQAIYEAYISGSSTDANGLAAITGLGVRTVQRHIAILEAAGRIKKRSGDFAPSQIKIPCADLHNLYLQKRRQRDWYYSLENDDDRAIFKRIVLALGEWVHRGKDMVELECLKNAELKPKTEKSVNER